MSEAATLTPPTPANIPEESLYEVVNGQRVEVPSMSGYASRIASRLQARMEPVADDNDLGIVITENLFILDHARDLRRRPDVAFVSADRWPVNQEPPEEGDWEVVPDLAVEVVSPHDKFLQVLAKMIEYFELGVRQVWLIIPPAKQIYVYESPTQVRILTEADDLDGGTLLPGFRTPVAQLFRKGKK